MTKSNWIGVIAASVAMFGIMVMIVLAYGQTSRDIGGMLEGQKSLQRSIDQLGEDIQAGNADLLQQLRNHAHVDGAWETSGIRFRQCNDTVFYNP